MLLFFVEHIHTFKNLIITPAINTEAIVTVVNPATNIFGRIYDSKNWRSCWLHDCAAATSSEMIKVPGKPNIQDIHRAMDKLHE